MRMYCVTSVLASASARFCSPQLQLAAISSKLTVICRPFHLLVAVVCLLFSTPAGCNQFIIILHSYAFFISQLLLFVCRPQLQRAAICSNSTLLLLIFLFIQQGVPKIFLLNLALGSLPMVQRGEESHQCFSSKLYKSMQRTIILEHTINNRLLYNINCMPIFYCFI